jgi:outer membrane protein insertion porin family
VRLGYPIWEYVYGYITYKNEGLQVSNPDPFISQFYQFLVNADQGVLSSIVWSVVRDKRNNRFETTDGNYQSATLETAGLGGDKDYLKVTLNNRYYTHVVGDLVFRNETEVGRMYPEGGKPLPPSEKYYLGGPNNMKGYDLFLLGPSVPNSTGAPIPLGGSTEIFSLFEFEHPLIREAGLKWVVFFDAGNVFNDTLNSNPVIRTDAGLGIRWFSPIGPLRFEWGFPFGPQPGQSTSVFNFFIGPPF